MYDIVMPDVSNEFIDCWKAAGRHIQAQAQDWITSWLRTHVQPPFLEHLSFNVGNQLYFIRVVDVDSHVESPGTLSGLFRVAENSRGSACLMPMKYINGDWIAVAPGWGFVDATSGESISPLDRMTEDPIVITDWELHDIAVQVVRKHIETEGFQVMSWNKDPDVNPSIWFVGPLGPEWVVVKGNRYPSKHAGPPQNIEEIAKSCLRQSSIGNFASVLIANHDDPFDPSAAKNGNFYPIYRGYKMAIGYQGYVRLAVGGKAH